MRPVRGSERILTEMWKARSVPGAGSMTSDGRGVEVLYPGRRNTDRGPDFVGAVIRLGGATESRGDVELHMRASDWRSHGHHLDPEYNRVILHVACRGRAPVSLENGGLAPTLELGWLPNGDTGGAVGEAPACPARREPCRGAAGVLGENAIGKLLDEAGDERFRLKADDLLVRLAFEGAEQLLYSDVLGALGYSKNRKPFLELAGRLPYADLMGACGDEGPAGSVVKLEALLFGMAGLLTVAGDERHVRLWRACGGGEPMPRSAWRLFRVRPANHPVNRIKGVARLLSRAREEGGLLDYAMRAVASAVAGQHGLERDFMVTAAPSPEANRSPLIGRGRARDLIVNVVLPFVHAWGSANCRAALCERALYLYRSHPPGAENNVTRELDALLGSRAGRTAASARRQQGLIHIAKTYCHRGDCRGCPVAAQLADRIADSRAQVYTSVLV